MAIVFSLVIVLQLSSLCWSQSEDQESICSHADCFQNQIGHDPTCGTNLLNFYSAKMARTIRDFITVTVNIDFWNSRHTPGYSGFNVSTSVNSETLTDELMKFVDNSKLLNRTTVGKIVNSILDQVANRTGLIKPLLSPPEFVCPISCSYEEQLLGALFAASLTLNILMIVGFAIFLFSQGRIGKKHKRLSNASA